MQLVQCQICSSMEFVVIQSTGVKFLDQYIDLVKCNQCGLVYLNPQPDDEELKAIYSDDYFKLWYSDDAKQALSQHYFHTLFESHRLSISPGDQLLDIGCGMGAFLQVAQNWQYNVKGVEISPYAANYCRNELKLDVHCGALHTAGYPENFFDVITAFDVLEHLGKVEGMLSTVKNILKTQGRFILLVPNYQSMVFQLDRFIRNKKSLPLPNVPEHLTYFTMNSLTTLLEKYGFKIEKIVTTHANVDGDYLKSQGGLMGKLRSILDNTWFQLGNVTNRRDAVLAVATIS